MDLGLTGKKAIVTGGSRGIGLAIVQTLLDEGATVATCARGKEALDARLDAWRSDGKTVYGEALDVTNAEAFESWLDSSVESMGGCDIFVSNVFSMLKSQGIERWQEAFEINLLQHIRATEKIVPYLPKGGDSAIVFIASIASVMNSNPTETEYGATKAALISYASQLATKLGPDNIRVNCVSPGPIYHEGGFWQMVEKQQPELFKRAQSVSVFNRLGTAQEVANSVVFLASPAASNITAANLRIDGAIIKTVNF
ncbi:MAG: SDR family oxidoreductase [Pseudomonadales bacterium]|nr:SDR family oxidoreductase [Pseudomonadales bacterium]